MADRVRVTRAALSFFKDFFYACRYVPEGCRMLKSLLILTALFFGLLSRLAFSSSSRIVEVPAIFWDEWWSTYAGSGGYDSTKHFEKCLEVEVSNLSTTSQTPQVTVLARTIPSAFR